MNRRGFLLILGTALVDAPAEAQNPTMYRIGGLALRASRPVTTQIWLDALARRGYAQGRNLSVEFRFGEPEELPELAAQLVKLDLRLITCASSASLQALMAVTRDVPIIALDLETDPIASGFAASLARPAGNMTGFFLDLPEFSAKRLELLKETLPRVRRVVVLWDPALDIAPVTSLERAAIDLKLPLLLKAIKDEATLIEAFQASSDVKAGAVMVMQSPRLDLLRPKILQLAADRRLPVAALFADFAADGGLLSYGPNVDDMLAQTSDYVDKILKGGKPGELPIQRPTRFDLVLSMRTAKRLGIKIPTSVSTRADVIIE
jgi:putative ABC transport system substrate-binding protein